MTVDRDSIKKYLNTPSKVKAKEEDTKVKTVKTLGAPLTKRIQEAIGGMQPENIKKAEVKLNPREDKMKGWARNVSL